MTATTRPIPPPPPLRPAPVRQPNPRTGHTGLTRIRVEGEPFVPGLNLAAHRLTMAAWGRRTRGRRRVHLLNPAGDPLCRTRAGIDLPRSPIRTLNPGAHRRCIHCGYLADRDYGTSRGAARRWLGEVAR